MLYDTEFLRSEANKARHVAIALAEHIYKYLGDCITKEELKLVTDALISPDLTAQFKHQYILKDTYSNMISNLFVEDLESMEAFPDDTESITLIEEGE